MKAYFLTPGPGGTGVELREPATPEPKPGELLVRVRATSLNRGELLGGKPGGPARAGGGECAGDVVKLGDGVTAVSTGDRVMGRCAGGFAEYALMDAREAMRVPGRLAKLGLDVGIRTRAADFHDAVLKATDGKGVSLVVNNVGGSVFAECIKSLAFEGRLATVGHMDRVLSAPLDLEALRSSLRAYVVLFAYPALAEARQTYKKLTNGGCLDAVHGMPISLNDFYK